MKRLFTPIFVLFLGLMGTSWAQTVSSVTTTNSTGSYKIGDNITIRVTFTSAVDVVSPPRIQLNVTPTTRYATTGNATNVTQVDFTYTIVAGDLSARLDYASTGALTLNGGTIFATGTSTPATLTLPALTTSGLYTTNLAIDGVAPGAFTVGSVTTTGGTVVASRWNSTNTGLTVDVPIGNDASLNGGSVQLQGRISSGVFANLGSASTIAAISTTKSISVTDAQFEAIAGFANGETIEITAIMTDVAGNAVTGTTSASTILVDQASPGAFTTGTVTATGGTVVASKWNASNTGVDITVPIANDASLLAGSIQLQARVSTGTFANLGAAATISAINTSQTVSATAAQLEAIASFADGETIEFRSILTDISGNPSTTGATSATTLFVDQTLPAAFTVGTIAPTGGTVVSGKWNSTNTGVDVSVPIANDATLNGGSIQIEGRVSSGSFAPIGSVATISAVNTTQTVSLSAAAFESITSFADGQTIEIRAAIADNAGNTTTGTASSSTVAVDQTPPSAFTVGSVTPTGGTQVTGVWNSTNTGVDIQVPIANDASLTGGSLQLRARISSGSFADIGSATVLAGGDLGTTKTISLTAAAFEAIAGFADGEVVEITAALVDSFGNSTTATTSATTILVDQAPPAAFTVGLITPTGGTVVSGRWNSTNTGININVPIANDASLNGGSIQLRGRVSSGSFANLGSAATISAINTTQTVSLTAATFESIASFADGQTIEVTAIITDINGNAGTTGTQSVTTISVDQTAPGAFTTGSVTPQVGTVVSGVWNSTNTGIRIVVPIANDATLNGGSVQIQGRVAAGSFANVASTFAIAAVNTTKNIDLTAAEFEGISGFAEGETIELLAIVSDVAGNATTGAQSATTIVVDQLSPAAFTVGSVVTTGGTITAGSWNSTNTGIDIQVPIANDASLSGGTLQIQARVTAGVFANLGSSASIAGGDLGANKTVSISAANFEAITSFADDAIIEITAIINDKNGNPSTTGSQSATTILVDQILPILSPDEMTFNPNGTSPEIVTFTISEELNLSEGAAVTGLSSSTGTIATALYTGKGTTNTITLTASADGNWTTATTISYNSGTGNVKDRNGNPLATITNHAVTQNVVNLSAGALAFTSFKSDDPNNFSFVLLRDISAGTSIKFTDNGWTSSNTLRTSEQTFTWTADVDYFAGSEITFTGNATGGGDGTITPSHGTVNPSGLGSELKLSTSGDQIIAYQGASTSPTIIAAMHFNGSSWDADANNDQTSALPTGLTNGTNAVAVANIDNGAYNRSTLSGSVAAVRSALNNNANWSTNDNPASVTFPTANLTAFTLPPDVTGAFTPAAGATITGTLPNLVINYTGTNLSAGTSTGSDIVLKRHSDGLVIQTWNVGTAAVSITGTTVTVNTSSLALVHNTTYRVEVAKRVFVNTDNNGNTAISGATWTFTADAVAPTVSSIVRTTPAGANTNATSVVYTVNFSENVNGISTADFALVTDAGVTGATIASVSASSGSSVTVTINTISGLGNLTLTIPGTATITDNGGNALSGTFPISGETYAIDQAAPTVSSIVRKTPATALTNAASLVFTVTFSEDINSGTFSAADLTTTLSGVTVGTPTINSVSSSVYDVTVPTVSGNGTVRLDIAGSATIDDVAGNDLSTSYTSGQVYTIDQIRPTVSSIVRKIPVTSASTTATQVTYTVTFSEGVSGFDASDVTPEVLTGTLNVGTVSLNVVPVSSTIYDVTIGGPGINAIAGDGTFRINIASTATLSDAAGNSYNADFTSGEVYDIDNVAPNITSITTNSTLTGNPAINGITPTAGEVVFKINFDDQVLGVSPNDFTVVVDPAGDCDSPIPTYTTLVTVASTGNSWDVTVQGVSGLGMIRLDFNDADATVVDGAGNPIANSLTTAFTGTQYFSLVKPQPTNHASNFGFTSTATDVTLTWTDPVAPAVAADYYIVMLKHPSASFPTVAEFDNGSLLNDFDFSDGTLAQYHYLGSGPSLQFFNLQSGVAYDVKWIPMSYTCNIVDYQNIDYLITGTPLTGVATTQVASSAFLSTPALGGVTIQSTIDTQGEAIENLQFTVTDEAVDLDNAPFKFKGLTITQGGANDIADWTQAIAGAALTDGSVTVVATGTDITATAINFPTIASSNPSDLGYVPDNGSKTYRLYVWLKSSLGGNLPNTIDGQFFSFHVDNSSFDPDNTSNGQQSTKFNGAQVIESPDNGVDVVATKLQFLTPGDPLANVINGVSTDPQPQIGVASNFPAATAPKVYAVDENENRDFNYNTVVTLSNSAGLTQSTNSASFSAGLLTLTSYNFLQVGSTQIRVHDPVFGASGDAVSSSVATVVTSTTNITAGATAEPATISSLVTTLGSAVQVFDFTVTDDVGANTITLADNDGLPTRFTQITVTPGTGNSSVLSNWTDAIQGATLTDGSTTVTGVVGAASIDFSGFANSAPGNFGYVTDNGNKTYRLRIYLRSAVVGIADQIDGEDFVFEVTNGTLLTVASPASSGLQSATVNSGDGNVAVSVVATRLDFTTQWAVNANQSYDAALSPSPVVKARDINGNLDINYAATPTVATASPVTYPMTNTTVTNTGGIITFDPNLMVTSAGGGASGASTNLIVSDGTLIQATSNLFKVNYSGSSDIVLGTYAYPTDILYANYQEAANLTVGTSVELEQFVVRDGAGAADADGSPTILNGITFDVQNWSNLRRLALYDGASEVAETTVTGATVSFTGISFTAPDNGSKTLSIRASFAASVTDNQVINFRVGTVSASATSSSQFGNTAPLGIQGTAAGNQNAIEVVATNLDIVSPVGATNVSIYTNFTPLVLARDGNSNLDLDFEGASGTVTAFANNAGVTMAGGPTVGSTQFTDGVLDFASLFPNFQFQSGNYADNVTLSMKAGTGTNCGVDAICTALTPALTLRTSTISAGALAEPATVSSIMAAGTGLFDFAVNDDDLVLSGSDAIPTLISQIVITPQGPNTISNWSQLISAATLRDGAGNVVSGTVNAANITFASIPNGVGQLGYIGDNTQKIYTLQITFNTSLTNSLRTTVDNEVLAFEVTAPNIQTLAAGTSSKFSDSEIESSGAETIIVTATRLAFTTQPPATASVDADLSIQPVLEAVDINGNTDEDYNGALTLTNSGTLQMVNVPATIASGIGTFATNFQYRQAGNGTLTANAPGLAGVTSTSVTVSFSTNSNIIKDGSFTYPDNIAYANYQATTIAQDGNSIDVEQFILQDGGGSNDADGAGTRLSALDLQIANGENIRRLALYDGAVKLAETAPSAAGVASFSGFALTTADFATKVFTVRASFLNKVDDNEVITFKVISATTSVGIGFGSSFALPDAGGALSAPAALSDNNRIEVTATQLDFTTVTIPIPDPPTLPPTITASINTNFNPVTVEARDANHNRDVDFTGTITLSGTTGGLTTTNNPSGAFVGGVKSYPVNFQYLTDGSPGVTIGKGTLTMTAGGISGTSAFITVLSSFDSRLEINSLSADATIDYAYYQGNSISASNSAIIATMDLFDGDADGDIDGANTNISSLTLQLTNPSNINKIALFDDSNVLIAGTEQALNGASTVTFSGLSITAVDTQNSTPGQMTFTVRATFQNDAANVHDNDLIQLQVTAASQNGGSKFINSTGSPTEDPAFIGGILNGSLGPVQNIAITATKFDFPTGLTPEFAGIDEPITIHTILAHDQFDLLDVDFNNTVTLSTPTTGGAGLSFTDPTFVNGALDLTGLQYTSPGDGTLKVDYNGQISSEETGTELGLTNVSVPGNHVDVIHVEAVEIVEGTGGVTSLANIQGGSINTTIFGFTFNVVNNYKTASEPTLGGFTITFDAPYKKSGAYSFKNFRVFESDNGTKDAQAKNITTLTGTVTEASSGSFGADLDQLVIAFGTDRPLFSGSKSYFLVADVDVTANKATASITPMLVDLGYGDNSDDNIITSKGSARSKGNNVDEGEIVKGLTFNFASSKPPKLVSSVPSNAKLNVSPDLSQIDLYFDVDVLTFDSKIELYNYKTDELIAELPAINGEYDGDIENLTFQVVTPISFAIPSTVVLKPDSLYYIKIAKGSYDPATNTGTGIADEGQNFFGGISYNGALYFKVSSPVPPKMLSTNASNYFMSNSAGIFNAEFDQKGKGYYLVLDHNQAITTPTNAHILDPTTYPEYGTAHISHGSFDINQVSPNLQYVPFTGDLSVTDYDIWIFAENDAEPTPKRTSAPYGSEPNFTVGGTGPTLQMTRPTSIANSNNPIIQVCPDSEIIVTDPIVIGEVNTGDFDGGGGVHDFNILLPTGVAFDIDHTPSVITSGDDFVGTPTVTFINNTILNIAFNNTGTTSLDNIIVSNMKLTVSASVESATINRFAGNAILSLLSDNTPLATISAVPIETQKFTNSFTTSNDFTAVGLESGAVINVIPDNFNEATSSVQLIPVITPSTDYGPNSFSGPGVTNDALSLTGVAKNTGFDIVMTHTDMNGCITTKTEQYLVYDHNDAIPLIGTKECITNVNFPGGDSPSIITGPTRELTYNAKAGYFLIGLYTSIPSKVTASSQIMFGPSWQQLIERIPVQTGSVSQGLNYQWDYAPLLNAVAESVSFAEPITVNPYDNFADKTPNNQSFWKGGSLGLVEFTGKYRNSADLSVVVPFRQEVEIYVPPIPVVEIRNKENVTTEVVCEKDPNFLIEGFPKSDAAFSTSFFVLRDSATNAIINAGSAFVDNSNGTASFNPSQLANTFKDKAIKVEYTYKDNASPCSGTGFAYLRVARNPVAVMAFASDLTVNTANAASYCEGINITFDASGSTLEGGTISDIAAFEWEFPDPNATTTSANTITAQHTYAATSSYDVKLRVTSNDGCVSDVQTKTINVGKIPEPEFSFEGISTADSIAFTSSSVVNSAPSLNDGLARLDWDFGNTKTKVVQSSFASPVRSKYDAAGRYTINLQVTSKLGCVNKIDHFIIVVPRSSPTDTQAYEVSFATDADGWQSNAMSGSTSSWARGNPSGKTGAPLNSATGVWVTSLATPYSSLERSALYSPSFDLSKLDRPMISFDHFIQVAAGEGASLEYSTDNKNVADPTKEWTVLGGFESGVEWYNEVGLSAQPGANNNEGLGWSGETQTWKESKHVLDAVLENPRVVFRFAFASQTADPVKDGFAIDNVRIGNRTRTVLVENFRNLGNTATNANGIIERVESDNLRTFKEGAVGTRLVKMNYHVGFPQVDPFNKDNPQDPSSRALYYNVRSTPVVRMDGDGEPGLFTTWGENWYNTQTLKLANAKIDINAGVNDQEGSIEVSVDIQSIRKTLVKDTTVLHVAIVEKSILKTDLPSSLEELVLTGEDEFEFVVKTMLPSAVGTPLTTTLNDGESMTISGFSWIPDRARLYSSDNLAIVAFLQNEKTKEVYQAEIVDLGQDPDEITGLEDGLRIEDVTLYPNPADHELTILLPRHAVNDVSIQLIDQAGRSIMSTQIQKGDRETTVNVRELPSSIYLIRLEENGRSTFKRAMIIHKN